MNGQRAVGLVAGAVLAAMLVTTAAVAASEPLTPQAIRAMGERYQAMAEHYGTSSSLPPEAIRAMGERYQAMAEHYGGSPDTGTATGLPPQARGAWDRWAAAAEYYRQAELEQARQAAGAFDWLDAGGRSARRDRGRGPPRIRRPGPGRARAQVGGPRRLITTASGGRRHTALPDVRRRRSMGFRVAVLVTWYPSPSDAVGMVGLGCGRSRSFAIEAQRQIIDSAMPTRISAVLLALRPRPV